MILDAINNKKIVFKIVLMDSWYVTQRLMALIDNDRKNYYCPLKKNPLVEIVMGYICLLYTSPSPRDTMSSRMPSSA